MFWHCCANEARWCRWPVDDRPSAATTATIRAPVSAESGRASMTSEEVASLCDALTRVAEHAEAIWHNAALASGLEPPEAKVLAMVDDHPVSLSELLHLMRHEADRRALVDDLVNAGLLRIVGDDLRRPDDPDAVTLALTPAGRALSTTLNAHLRVGCAELVGPLSADDRERVLDGLHPLTRAAWPVPPRRRHLRAL